MHSKSNNQFPIYKKYRYGRETAWIRACTVIQGDISWYREKRKSLFEEMLDIKLLFLLFVFLALNRCINAYSIATLFYLYGCINGNTQ